MAEVRVFQLFQIGFLCVFLLVALTIALVFARYFRLWVKAFMSGAPIHVAQLIGMTLRRTNPNVIVDNYILAKQSGLNVTALDLEKAYLKGVDIEKVTLAAIHADRGKKELSFQDLVDAEIEDRLADKLGR